MTRPPTAPVPVVAALVLAVSWMGVVLGLLIMLAAPANLLAAVAVTLVFAWVAARAGGMAGDSDRTVRAHKFRMGVYA